MTDALTTWVAIVGGLLVIVGVLWRTVGRPIRQLVVRLDLFWDDWHGTGARPGRPEQPGVLERLAAIEHRQAGTEAAVEEIKHELRPNSGASLRDAVDRVEQAVTPGP
ncbi:hypothetical protein OG216_26040 [Streptomycetaceae bacterium NBC_01309]